MTLKRLETFMFSLTLSNFHVISRKIGIIRENCLYEKLKLLYYLVHVVIMDSLMSQKFSKTKVVIDICLSVQDLVFR